MLVCSWFQIRHLTKSEPGPLVYIPVYPPSPLNRIFKPLFLLLLAGTAALYFSPTFLLSPSRQPHHPTPPHRKQFHSPMEFRRLPNRESSCSCRTSRHWRRERLHHPPRPRAAAVQIEPRRRRRVDALHMAHWEAEKLRWVSGVFYYTGTDCDWAYHVGCVHSGQCYSVGLLGNFHCE